MRLRLIPGRGERVVVVVVGGERSVAVRSALPDGNISWIRDTRTIATLPSAVRFLTPVGVAAVPQTVP